MLQFQLLNLEVCYCDYIFIIYCNKYSIDVAMENWGIILYAEQHFLFNKTTGTQDAEMNIIQAMAHEVAHMWFGNLVTHKWLL